MSNQLQIKIVDSPEQSPNYSRDTLDIRGCSITQAIIVCKGTQEGRCTVDFQITAQDGTQFVAMLTGRIVTALAAAIAGAEARG